LSLRAQAGDLQAEAVQGLGDGLWVDLGVGVVRGGPRGDQQVRVGGGRPSPVPFGQPPGEEAEGDFVQVEGVVEPSGAADGEAAPAAVHIVEQQPALVVAAQGVNGRQHETELVACLGKLVEDAVEVVVGQRDRQPPTAGQHDGAGGIPVAIASNESFSGWTKTFTDPRLCAAIVDRLTFGGNLIQTGTDSYRLAITQARAAAQDTRLAR
jgi:hypothetical protein